MDSGINTERLRREHGTAVRLGNILLMLTFTFCSFALVGAAASCFEGISDSYSSAGNGMAAAEFIVNRIRSVDGDVEIIRGENGSCSRLIISDDEYSDVIFVRDGSLCEAYVPRNESRDLLLAAGDAVFSVSDLKAELRDGRVLKITVITENGSSYTAFAACE
ncbi:MAG: DUF4860 domain-containing protein [Huintestinicola sp.]